MMTLKTATHLAIIGTAVGLLASLFGQISNQFLYRSGGPPDPGMMLIVRYVYLLRPFFFEGSLLLFFITLYRTRRSEPGVPSD